MKICKGKVVGLNSYEKDGRQNYYAQVVYKSAIPSYTGERVFSCKMEVAPKIGQEVKVLDDFRYPNVIEE